VWHSWLHRLAVRFSTKIRKLFSPEIFASTKENAARWTHPVNAKRILETIDRDQLAKLRQQFPHRRDARKINAFENANYWVGVNVKRIQDLWLDRTKPLRILDLGCGPGYFLYICQMFGHSGIGLDQDEEPLFRGMTELFNVRRVISRIDRQTSLPELGERFDLVTAHRVCFHRISRAPNGYWIEWTPADWKFFINDVRRRFLKPDGRLFLEFNPRRDGSSFFTAELRECFLSEGARIFRSKALFAADPKRRPRFKL
jgi:SAM-dependent methyltransferase